MRKVISRRALLVASAAVGAMGKTEELFAQATQPAWAPWADLLNALPASATLMAKRVERNLANVNLNVQKIENATGDHVNFDSYVVRITRLPATAANAEKLLENVRKKLNDFLDPSFSTFGPLDSSDGPDWTGQGAARPGCCMLFKIPLFVGIHEQAAVVTSMGAANKWIFTPITVDKFSPGEHPVSGNREFGVRSVQGGAYEIYTRAADRVLASVLPGEQRVFDGADSLWKSWQARVVSQINGNGGQAAALPPVKHRPTWSAVQASGLFSR